MDVIKRDVFITRDSIKDPIEYVQGADSVPILLEIRDYNVPNFATTKVYVEKPSTKAIYNNAWINNNVVTIDINKQMVAEIGESKLQVEIKIEERTLLTFTWPIIVKKSLIPINSENGSNFIDEYIEKIEQEIEESKQTREELTEAAQNGEFSATVEAGRTDTLEPGKMAQVKNSGTKKDAIFDFAIPQGHVGPQGPQGIQGEKGEKGEKGENGEAAITSLSPGVFAVTVNSNGHLILRHNTGEPEPPLKIIGDRLKYIIGEGE